MITYKFNLEVKVEESEEDDLEIIRSIVQDALMAYTEVNVIYDKTEED